MTNPTLLHVGSDASLPLPTQPGRPGPRTLTAALHPGPQGVLSSGLCPLPLASKGTKNVLGCPRLRACSFSLGSTGFQHFTMLQKALGFLLRKQAGEFARGRPQDPCWREAVCGTSFAVEQKFQTQGPRVPPGAPGFACAEGEGGTGRREGGGHLAWTRSIAHSLSLEVLQSDGPEGDTESQVRRTQRGSGVSGTTSGHRFHLTLTVPRTETA